MYSIDHINATWTFTQDLQRLTFHDISCDSRKNHCFVIGFLRQQLQRLRHQSFQVTMPRRVSPNSSVASRGWAVLLPARMEVACNFPLLWALEWCDVQCVYSTIYIYLVYYLLFVHHDLVSLHFFFNTCFRSIFIWVNWSGVSWLQPKRHFRIFEFGGNYSSWYLIYCILFDFVYTCFFWVVATQILFIFIPIWGNDPIWQAYFSDGWFNHQLVLHEERSTGQDPSWFSKRFPGFIADMGCASDGVLRKRN